VTAPPRALRPQEGPSGPPGAPLGPRASTPARRGLGGPRRPRRRARPLDHLLSGSDGRFFCTGSRPGATDRVSHRPHEAGHRPWPPSPMPAVPGPVSWGRCRRGREIQAKGAVPSNAHARGRHRTDLGRANRDAKAPATRAATPWDSGFPRFPSAAGVARPARAISRRTQSASPRYSIRT